MAAKNRTRGLGFIRIPGGGFMLFSGGCESVLGLEAGLHLIARL